MEIGGGGAVWKSIAEALMFPNCDVEQSDPKGFGQRRCTPALGVTWQIVDTETGRLKLAFKGPSLLLLHKANSTGQHLTL